MANFNSLPNASVEYLPSLTSVSVPIKCNTTQTENSQKDQTQSCRLLEQNRTSSEELADANTSSNVTSFDDILRDIIETSKNHMINQMQQRASQPTINSMTSFIPPTNFYQNFANFTGGLTNFNPPCSQSPNFPNNYNYNNLNYAENFANDNSYDNYYDTLIETIYEDTNDKTNLSDNIITSTTVAGTEDYNGNSCSNFVCDIKTNDNTSEVFEDQNILTNRNNFETSSKTNEEIPQIKIETANQIYLNQIGQPQTFQIPLQPSLLQQQAPLKQNNNVSKQFKVFSPKLLSMDGGPPYSSGNTSSTLFHRNYTNMPPPTFTISNSSAFNPYRKKAQKRTSSQNYTVNAQSTMEPEAMNNQENMFQLRPEQSNVFVVSEQSLQTGQPEWLIEKRYVPIEMITVRPPMQTKRTIEKAKEVALNDLFAIDFSSLDTSNIVIPTIQIKDPPHKKRKQDLKVLKGFENVDFEETTFDDQSEINSNLPINREISTSTNIVPNESVNSKMIVEHNDKRFLNDNSDTDDEIETRLRSMLSPIDQTLNIKTVVVDDKVLMDDLCRNDQNYLRKSNICYNEDDGSEVGSIEEELAKTKPLKCKGCNKIFKSINTLKRHKKKCSLLVLGNANEKVIIEEENLSKNCIKSSKSTLKNVSPLITTTREKTKECNEKLEVFNEGKKPVDTHFHKKKLNVKKSEKEKYQKDNIKTSEIKVSLNETNNKNQTMSEEKQKREKKGVKRRSATSIVIEDSKTNNEYNIDDKKKRKTRSNIISYKE